MKKITTEKRSHIERFKNELNRLGSQYGYKVCVWGFTYSHDVFVGIYDYDVTTSASRVIDMRDIHATDSPETFAYDIFSDLLASAKNDISKNEEEQK